MSWRKCKLQIASACVFALTPTAVVAAPFSFDDVDYWVGSGTNRAALVIDWMEAAAEPPALAWGFRWDGEAFGRDMLQAILADDDRLFAKLGGSAANPVAVYGLGYDANDDGEFALDDETVFDANGVDVTGPADGSVSLDAADYYAEGWFTGFWHYGIASANPFADGIWSDTPLGMAGRELSDGAWDSWTFTPTFDFAAFAENPVAAVPPDTGPFDRPGDFNVDGQVNGADYQLWKDTFGSITELAADANGNLVVDAGDYTVWRNSLRLQNPAAFSSSTVPEPATVQLTVCLFGILLMFFTRRRKEGSS